MAFFPPASASRTVRRRNRQVLALRIALLVAVTAPPLLLLWLWP
jgi:hypothetical protein